MTDEVYQPVLSSEKAQKRLDDVLDRYQIDFIPRADLGEDGPRRIPLTTERHAALAVFAALSDRKGLDLHELGIDQGVICEIVDEATDIIGQAFNLGNGPITLDVAHRINTLHNEGYHWHAGYNAAENEFSFRQWRLSSPGKESGAGGGESSDSLFAAIRDAQRPMNGVEND